MFYFVVLCLVISQIAAEDCVVTNYTNVAQAVKSCQNILIDSLVVPGGETLYLPLQPGSHLTFRGTTTFEHYVRSDYLIVITGTDVVIDGEDDSVLNGHGELYWKTPQTNGERPKFFEMSLHNAVVGNIHILNAPIHCVQLFNSTNVLFHDWIIDNSVGNDKASNTDGFDVRNSTNITFKDTTVYNQDDCVALNSGSNILVDNFTCYGSHGLSLSVGFSDDDFSLNSLQNVTFSNSIVANGENGIHIKTHSTSGDGIIRNVTYKNIDIYNVFKYGLEVEENYGNKDEPPKANIPIHDLTLENVVGNSTGIGIFILCADEGCFNWQFTNVVIEGSKANNCSYTPQNFTC